MLKNNLLLQALKGEPTERAPVWMMRQAGRFLPEYRSIRSRYDFLTMVKTPEIAAEVTIQPVDILGVDAAILFSDILVVPEAMGMPLSMNEETGPSLGKGLSSAGDIEALEVSGIERRLGYVLEAVHLTKQRLEGRVPLIGFSATPWTLMAYMVEGNAKKGFPKAKSLLYGDPGLSRRLLEKLTDAVCTYLEAKVQAGVDAIQLFDTWSETLSKDAFLAFDLPYVYEVIRRLKERLGGRVPIVWFFKGCASSLEEITNVPIDGVSLDWTLDLGWAIPKIPKELALQGNLDPCVLLASKEAIRKETGRILSKVDNRPGYVFNLGHGVLPQTPVDNARFLVSLVKEATQRHL